MLRGLQGCKCRPGSRLSFPGAPQVVTPSLSGTRTHASPVTTAEAPAEQSSLMPMSWGSPSPSPPSSLCHQGVVTLLSQRCSLSNELPAGSGGAVPEVGPRCYQQEQSPTLV